MNKELQELRQLLQHFLHEMRDEPEQRSEKWKAVRSVTVGGSEVGVLLGSKGYKSRKALIKEKVTKQSNFYGNLSTRWGIVYEPITKQWAQEVLDMEDRIEETGSLPTGIQGLRCSPDGIGIVALHDDLIIGYRDESNTDGKRYYIIVFEFKAPFSKINSPNEVPDIYQPQIQTELFAVPISSYSIFISNVYRKCGLSDFGFSPICDLSFHKSQKTQEQDILRSYIEVNKDNVVLACGIICFYAKKRSLADLFLEHKIENDGTPEMQEIFDLNKDRTPIERDFVYDTSSDLEMLHKGWIEPIDFGSDEADKINSLFYMVEKSYVRVGHSKIYHNYKNLNRLRLLRLNRSYHNKHTLDQDQLSIVANLELEEFKNNCLEEEFICGFMPWKLLRSSMALSERELEWENQASQAVERFFIDVEEAKKDLIAEEHDEQHMEESHMEDYVKLD